jgi:hypothetical protein
MSLLGTGLIANLWTGMNNITGDPYISGIIFILLFTIIFVVLWKVPLEWTALSILVIIITLLAYSGEWIAFAGILFIILAAWIAKNWITS